MRNSASVAEETNDVHGTPSIPQLKTVNCKGKALKPKVVDLIVPTLI